MFATDYFDAISEDAVLTGVNITEKSGLIAFLAAQFSRNYGLDQALCEKTLSEREALGSTGFGRRMAGLTAFQPLSALSFNSNSLWIIALLTRSRLT